MNIQDFQAPEAGHFVQTPQGPPAFVPAPLPPRLIHDPPLVLALSRADAALSELAGLGRTLPNPVSSSRPMSAAKPFSPAASKAPRPISPLCSGMNWPRREKLRQEETKEIHRPIKK